MRLLPSNRHKPSRPLTPRLACRTASRSSRASPRPVGTLGPHPPGELQGDCGCGGGASKSGFRLRHGAARAQRAARSETLFTPTAAAEAGRYIQPTGSRVTSSPTTSKNEANPKEPMPPSGGAPLRSSPRPCVQRRQGQAQRQGRAKCASSIAARGCRPVPRDAA